MKQKKEIETKDEAIRVMQHKIAEEKTKGESVINKLKKDLIKQTTISKSLEQKIKQNKVNFESSLSKLKNEIGRKEKQILVGKDEQEIPVKIVKNNSSNYKFPCEKCGFKARTENILEMHLCRDRTIEHWKNPLNCEICDYEAFNKLDFDSHIHCEKCQEDFKDMDHLEQHNLFEEH